MKTLARRFFGTVGMLALLLWTGSAHAMVYVRSIPELTSDPDTLKDLFYLSHVDYALKTTGGDLVDEKVGVANIKPDETLHIVAHGGPGSLQGIPIENLAKVLKGLPASYQGRIVVTACYSSAVVDGGKTTLRQIADALKATGHKVTLIGNKGPSVTNIHMKPAIAYVSEANTPAAGDIQVAMTDEAKGAFSTLNSGWQTKSAALVKSKADARAMVQAAAEHAKTFYQAFYDELARRNLVSPESEMLTSIDIL